MNILRQTLVGISTRNNATQSVRLILSDSEDFTVSCASEFYAAINGIMHTMKVGMNDLLIFTDDVTITGISDSYMLIDGMPKYVLSIQTSNGGNVSFTSDDVISLTSINS